MPRVLPRRSGGRPVAAQAARRGVAQAGALKVWVGATPPPSQVAQWMRDTPPVGAVALDTETSGKFGDDGARVSTVSLCWADPDREWRDRGLTWRVEAIAPGYQVPLVSVAWPFDQGVEAWWDRDPKDEYKGQASLDLFPEDHNLGEDEWGALVTLTRSLRLAFHNAYFDLEKMQVGHRVWGGGVDLTEQFEWCSMLAAELLWPGEELALKATGTRLWPDGNWSDEQQVIKDYLRKARLPAGRWDLMPWSVIGKYAEVDARLTKMVELRQRRSVRQGTVGAWFQRDRGRVAFSGELKLKQALDRRFEVCRTLLRMTQRGLPYDAVGSRLAADQVRERQRGVAQELPFDPKEAKEFYFGSKFGWTSKKGHRGLGLEPYATTDTGAPSMTAEVVSRMANEDVPHARTYAAWRKLDTCQAMWYVGYADKTAGDGRLRTYFRQTGTRSSRFSVERANLQAIPQDYRLSGFPELEGIPTPRDLIGRAVVNGLPGFELWELDLEQAELRVAALFAQCQTMLEMIRNGDDLHGYTTSELFKIKPGDDDWGHMRQVGKRANFSLCFGSGWETFDGMISKETGIYLGEARSRKIVKDWNALYPEYGRAIRRHMAHVDRRREEFGLGWVQFNNRERRWFGNGNPKAKDPKKRYPEDTHKAFNQRVQGNLAQFAIDWMLGSERLLRPVAYTPDGELTGAGLVLTIHDSQVLLLPKDRADELATGCATMAETLWGDWFPGVPGGVEAKRWKAA